ncbi:DUF1127 domain-containing protein [Methylobacterium sp. E-046]|uniref:DUF1127 domain-containing protein n=1 Tax=Methylobacterium sp. E-046 TaxID=2836576 RepID=UPI001FB9F766|nr:DUF1127 domain-containing protein [Methylobacterium sp. E-046]MCJ2103762.1 DUF1127 domain-containing protein [Methylobacterium sp. E-046]
MMRANDNTATLIQPDIDKQQIFRHDGGSFMLLSFLKSAQKRRMAARNFRLLSALDDEMLRDIGLDRRTLATFCENGCTHSPAPPSRPAAPWTAAVSASLAPGTLGSALR